MSELRWTNTVPTVQGWYWIKWNKGERDEGQVGLWFFDCSEWDVHQLRTRASRYYGPLQPPEDNE